MAQGQVQGQGHQGPLGVVGDQGVRAVLVGLVELGPGVEARFRERLHQAPRGAQDPGDALGQQFQVARLLDAAAAHQGQVVVVGGHALEGPQGAGVDLGAQVPVQQCLGLDAFDVPEVEVLVAGQAQETPVALPGGLAGGLRAGALGQVLAVAYQAGGVAVLQAAIALAQGGDQEQVAVQGQLAEQGRLFGADPGQVARQARLVAAVAPADGDPVGDAQDLEGDQAEAAHLHRVVDEVRVALGLVAAEAQGLGGQGPQAGGHPPGGAQVAGWWQQFQGAGGPVQVGHTQQQGGAVEVGVLGVQMGAAHRQVPGIDPVAHRDWPAPGATPGVQGPGLLVALGQGQGPGGVGGGYVQDVAGEVPDHVAPGDPGRQGQAQGRAWAGDMDLHPEQVGLGLGGGDAVGQVHRGSWLKGGALR